MTSPIDRNSSASNSYALATAAEAESSFAADVCPAEPLVNADASFPNAEVYLTDRVGNTLMLDTFQTEGGEAFGPLLHLPGTGDAQLGSFDVRVPVNDDGTFRMTCE